MNGTTTSEAVRIPFYHLASVWNLVNATAWHLFVWSNGDYPFDISPEAVPVSPAVQVNYTVISRKFYVATTTEPIVLNEKHVRLPERTTVAR